MQRQRYRSGVFTAVVRDHQNTLIAPARSRRLPVKEWVSMRVRCSECSAARTRARPVPPIAVRVRAQKPRKPDKSCPISVSIPATGAPNQITMAPNYPRNFAETALSHRKFSFPNTAIHRPRRMHMPNAYSAPSFSSSTAMDTRNPDNASSQQSFCPAVIAHVVDCVTSPPPISYTRRPARSVHLDQPGAGGLLEGL